MMNQNICFKLQTAAKPGANVDGYLVIYLGQYIVEAAVLIVSQLCSFSKDDHDDDHDKI